MPEKILFVDDEEQIRKLVGTFLDRRGYTVRTARNGVEALRLVLEDLPDLVVTDVAMPELDGVGLAKQLRANPRTARLPIIMLSAHRETGDVLTGYSAGADEYVPKPVELSVLGAKVEVVLRRARGAASDAAKQHGVVSLFMHGKGGVGTTTLAVSTAILLAEITRSRVAVLDLNLGFSNAELLLDIEPAGRLDQLALFDIGRMDASTFAEFLTQHSSGISVLAGPLSPELAENITPSIVESTVERLRGVVAHVIVDLPISFSEINLTALDAADTVCMVTSPELAALKVTRDCLRITNKLSVVPPERTMAVLNRTVSRGLSNDAVTEFLRQKVAVIVPHDPLFTDCANEGRPFVTAHRPRPASQAILELAKKIAASRVLKHDEQTVLAS